MRVRSHPIRRVVGGLSVIAVAVVLAPAAAVPGFNGADLLVLLAPFVFLFVVLPKGGRS
ncbi:hypothetical protein [Microbacterium sp. CSI-V]|uniref:hypothetical protein n=1 Tax=Microbacterium sp. CSI-V TaxID=1933777 RepID=UPI00158F5649|nr:hypothetical protein [Microbacterium sp. CSI-V]